MNDNEILTQNVRGSIRIYDYPSVRALLIQIEYAPYHTIVKFWQ